MNADSVEVAGPASGQELLDAVVIAVQPVRVQTRRSPGGAECFARLVLADWLVADVDFLPADDWPGAVSVYSTSRDTDSQRDAACRLYDGLVAATPWSLQLTSDDLSEPSRPGTQSVDLTDRDSSPVEQA